jgi:hypothetical protein
VREGYWKERIVRRKDGGMRGGVGFEAVEGRGGKERKGKERKGKERKGKERKGKERKGKERRGVLV